MKFKVKRGGGGGDSNVFLGFSVCVCVCVYWSVCLCVFEHTWKNLQELVSVREGGDIGLEIALVTKVLLPLSYLILGLNIFWFFLFCLIGFKLEMFKSFNQKL